MLAATPRPHDHPREDVDIERVDFGKNFQYCRDIIAVAMAAQTPEYARVIEIIPITFSVKNARTANINALQQNKRARTMKILTAQNQAGICALSLLIHFVFKPKS